MLTVVGRRLPLDKTFLGAPLSFRALPRPYFATLQSTIFPAYFGVQTVLPLVVAATYPGQHTSTGTWVEFGPQSVSGVLGERAALVPLVTTFVAGLVNILAVRPVVARIMEERRKQGAYLLNPHIHIILVPIHTSPTYPILSSNLHD